MCCSSRFSFWRALGSVRLVVIDCRQSRVLEPGARRMIADDDWAWVVSHADVECEHLVLAASVPVVMPGGVHGSAQVLKAMMAGARVAMMTSALLQHGIGHLAHVRADIVEWMETHEYASIAEMQGSMSYRAVSEPAAFERANYMKVLSSYALRGPR